MRNRRPLPFRVLLVDEALTLATRGRALFDSQELLRPLPGASPARMLHATAEKTPDVIVLELPREQRAVEAALSAVEAVMAQRPTPILVLEGKGGRESFRALSLGALDLVTLPDDAAPPEAHETFWRELSHRVALLAQVRVVQHVGGMRRRRLEARTQAAVDEAPFPIVAIAASLGGPRAIAQLLSALPRVLAAPVCICQHISEGFTSALAHWLSQETGQRVEEARDDRLLEPGRVYLAPSGKHFRVASQGRVRLDDGPPIAGFRPACDALLESVAHSFGRRAVGVILTGMGRDGAQGLKAIRDHGGRTLAQDELTCAVWGMPREAVRIGAAEQVLPLDALPPAIVKLVDAC